jgi:hypothetical protein
LLSFLAVSHLLKDLSIDLSQHAAILCKSLAGIDFFVFAASWGLIPVV